MKFEDYFSFEAILGDLVKWRLAGKDVGGTLPPRKMWSRAGAKERKGIDPRVVRKQSIYRTILKYGSVTAQLPPHLYKSGGSRNSFSPASRLDETTWGRKLLALVKEVQESVFSGKVEFEKPRMIQVPKGYKDGWCFGMSHLSIAWWTA